MCYLLKREDIKHIRSFIVMKCNADKTPLSDEGMKEVLDYCIGMLENFGTINYAELHHRINKLSRSDQSS